MVREMDQRVLSPDQRESIGQAIELAEAKTAGEIFVVIARKSGDYGWTTFVYGIVLALIAPVILLVLGINPLDLADWLTRLTKGGWSLGIGASARDEAATGMAIMVAIQAVTLIIVSALGLNGDFREALTPGFVKRQSVHKAALEQFLAHGIHLTTGRTGVLIFASLSEHQAEIIADTDIYQKVDQHVWSEAIQLLLAGARDGNLTAGLISAIDKSGEILAQHFPREAGDTNELPNKVVVI